MFLVHVTNSNQYLANYIRLTLLDYVMICKYDEGPLRLVNKHTNTHTGIFTICIMPDFTNTDGARLECLQYIISVI